MLLTFNKLKSLTTEAKVVVDALKGSDLCEVNDDGDKLRRSADLSIRARNVHCMSKVTLSTMLM